jgi:putative glutamine amidotransferase
MAAPLIALPAYPMKPGRVDGWADPAFAIQAMYVESLQRAGAQEAVLGPRHLDHGEALAVLERFDGLLLPGGGDVIPERYGAPRAEQTYGTIPLRDEFEFALCNAALELARPLFAICRGTQVLNVALGGTLTQHITDDFPGHGTPGVEGGQHVHDISIEAESRAGAAMGTTRTRCSCHHHQAVARVGRGLRVTARADDGIVEAMELEGPTWVTAVQWHPEDTAAGDPAQQGLFDAFVATTRR